MQDFMCAAKPQALVVSIDDILARAYCPLNDFHAAEATGPKALIAALKAVEITVRPISQSLATEMREVVPLTECAYVIGWDGSRLRSNIPGVFVDFREGGFQEGAGRGLGLIFIVWTPGPGCRYVGFGTKTQDGHRLTQVGWGDTRVGAIRNV